MTNLNLRALKLTLRAPSFAGLEMQPVLHVCECTCLYFYVCILYVMYILYIFIIVPHLSRKGPPFQVICYVSVHGELCGRTRCFTSAARMKQIGRSEASSEAKAGNAESFACVHTCSSRIRLPRGALIEFISTLQRRSLHRLG